MNVIFQFFKHIAINYGTTFAVLFLILALVLFGIFFIVKTFPDLIKDYVEHKLIDGNQIHRNRTIKRKNVSPLITKKLSKLIVDTNADRALLLEFTNGTSNLAGLPFLFISATSESLSMGTSSVAHIYQRINISLFANFILDLEHNSYFYAKDIEDMKTDYPFIYNFMSPNGVKSVLFYSIYGVNDTLGFIVLTSINGKTFTRKDALPLIAGTAQKVSSLLNLEELGEEIK